MTSYFNTFCVRSIRFDSTGDARSVTDRAVTNMRWARQEDISERSFLNECLRFCGGDMARASYCCRHRQCAPHLESNARKCDMRATLRMIHAHGTYVPPSVVMETDCTYVAINNNKKRETPWSRRAQQREMIHGFRPIHRRTTGLHCRNAFTDSLRNLPAVLRCIDVVASASG